MNFLQNDTEMSRIFTHGSLVLAARTIRIVSSKTRMALSRAYTSAKAANVAKILNIDEFSKKNPSQHTPCNSLLLVMP